jgi:UDPglucose 6-dehydrogenase
MGLDKRIGSGFLKAGIGYGGSCFPKDLDAFITISEKIGYSFDLLKAARRINEEQKEVFLAKIKSNLWILKDKTLGVLGLSFKPNTDDIRNAPAIDILRILEAEGARVRVYDPSAMNKTKDLLRLKKTTFCAQPYEVAKGSEALLILTEWDEFKALDFTKIKKLLKRPLIIDGRNMLEPAKMKKMGFTYICIGRRE